MLAVRYWLSSAVAEGDLHSARTKSFALTKSGNVSFVREATSEAEAMAAAARPSASVVKERILTVCARNERALCQVVSMCEAEGQALVVVLKF